jgi:hypothetical protein
MVGFFPTPYPDECLYSVLCRYYARGGYGSYESCVRELYGGVQNLTLSVFLPMKIETVDSWYSPSSGITRRSLAEGNTLYPYWAMCYTPTFRTKMDDMINGGVTVIETNNEGSLRSRRSWPKYLKYCPKCYIEDTDAYGESYWRRQHQLSEMFYCTKHKIRLADSSITIRQTGAGFYPASTVIDTERDANNHDELVESFKDKLLLIAGESEWLIRYGLDVDWGENGRDKYGKLLRDKGLASFRGRCDYPSLEASLNGYWGSELLQFLISQTADTRFSGWINRIERNKMRAFLPLYHILLMCFLAGSVSGFVTSAPADTPYGHPPFECENPVCSHYHVNGAELVDFSYYGNGARATFECADCGMRYKINKSKHSRELRVITKYGELWEREFLRCCQNKSITNEKMAEIFHCDHNTIILQKKKRGLLRQMPYYVLGVSPYDYYKAEVEAVCAEYDEVTIALLNEKVPGAYDYLKDHEPEWIRSRIVFGNEQRHIREYEAQLLGSVQSVVAQLKTDGYPKRQVSYGYIAELAGSARDKLRCRRAIRDLLDGIVESKSDWLLRRATEVCGVRKDLGKPTTTKTIKRELYLREATFKQYENLIQEVIDTAYE